MKPLEGKHILICRARRNNDAFENAFGKQGAQVTFFSTFRIEILKAELDDQIATALRSLSDYDWLILSSANGIRALRENLEALRLSPFHLGDAKIGIVGKKTASIFADSFPHKEVSLAAESLQELLNEIQSAEREASVSAIHLTSVQSPENIEIDIPDGMKLLRLPLYQTIMDDSHSSEAVRKIKNSNYDVIVFTSPTSFDYFLDLVGDDRLILDSRVAVLGDTTKHHIQSRGYGVEIVASKPEAQTLANAAAGRFAGEQINETVGKG